MCWPMQHSKTLDRAWHFWESATLVNSVQIPALFQPIEGFPHHAIAEMSLAHAQQFRAAPFLVDRFYLTCWRD